MPFYLTEKAKHDLKNIARHTQEKWGKAQRNAYLMQLDASFHDLAKAPGIGAICDYIRPGYSKLKVGRHLIFYHPVEQGKEIEIVRILHERMDIDDHL
jgi:toxin ParE1/3/4